MKCFSFAANSFHQGIPVMKIIHNYLLDDKTHPGYFLIISNEEHICSSCHRPMRCKDRRARIGKTFDGDACTVSTAISCTTNCRISLLNSNTMKFRLSRMSLTEICPLKTVTKRRLKQPCTDGVSGLIPCVPFSTPYSMLSVPCWRTSSPTCLERCR